MMRSRLKYWIPVGAWMLLIFLASGDLMSAEHTSRILVPFLRWIVPDISPATVASIQFLVRKCAHLTEYAILAALLLRAIRRSRPEFTPYLWRQTAIAFLIAAAFASLDEFYQSKVVSRTGSHWDVLIDCGGALFGLAIYSRFTRAPKR